MVGALGKASWWTETESERHRNRSGGQADHSSMVPSDVRVRGHSNLRRMTVGQIKNEGVNIAIEDDSYRSTTKSRLGPWHLHRLH